MQQKQFTPNTYLHQRGYWPKTWIAYVLSHGGTLSNENLFRTWSTQYTAHDMPLHSATSDEKKRQSSTQFNKVGPALTSLQWYPESHAYSDAQARAKDKNAQARANENNAQARVQMENANVCVKPQAHMRFARKWSVIHTIQTNNSALNIRSTGPARQKTFKRH